MVMEGDAFVTCKTRGIFSFRILGSFGKKSVFLLDLPPFRIIPSAR